MGTVTGRFRVSIVLLIVGVLLLSQVRSRAQESRAMLAVVGSDANVYVYDAEGRNPSAITIDGVPDRRVYIWPTWSTDGRLAFFGVSIDPGDLYSLRVFVQERVEPGETYHQAYTSLAETFTYAYWSPGNNCPASDCRDLALLFTPANRSSLAVRMIRDEKGQFTDRLIERGAPFYYSFSPDGQKMLWHRFARQLEIYDVQAGRVTQHLPDTPGAFQAPMWSPVDDRWLFAVAGSEPDRADIVIADGEARRVLLPDQPAPVSFAWSPDSTRIASVAGSGRLVITDVASGATVVENSQSYVLAYFWAPQGDRVMFVGIVRDPNAPVVFRSNGHSAAGNRAFAVQSRPDLVWSLLDVNTGSVTSLARFFPSSSMLYYLNFFDQFSRSHSLWSPDGRYFVYGEVDVDRNERVMLIDTRNPGSPRKVAEGSLGIWSWR